MFLALSPWHLQVSRLGFEASLTPLFPILGLFLLAVAGWPLRSGNPSETPVTLRGYAMVAFGAVLALAFYSYASMKLFVPAFFVAGVFIYRTPLIDLARARSTRRPRVLRLRNSSDAPCASNEEPVNSRCR